MSLYELFLDRIESLPSHEDFLDTHFRVFACQLLGACSNSEEETISSVHQTHCPMLWVKMGSASGTVAKESRAFENYKNLSEIQRYVFFVTVGAKLLLFHVNKAFNQQKRYGYRQHQRKKELIRNLAYLCEQGLEVTHLTALSCMWDKEKGALSKAIPRALGVERKRLVSSHTHGLETNKEDEVSRSLNTSMTKETSTCRSNDDSTAVEQDENCDAVEYIRQIEEWKHEVREDILAYIARLCLTIAPLTVSTIFSATTQHQLRIVVKHVEHVIRSDPRPRDLLSEYHNSRNAQYSNFIEKWGKYLVHCYEHIQMKKRTDDEKVCVPRGDAGGRYSEEEIDVYSPRSPKSAFNEIERASFEEVELMLKVFMESQTPRESRFFELWLVAVRQLESVKGKGDQQCIVDQVSSVVAEEADVMCGTSGCATKTTSDLELVRKAEALLYPSEMQFCGDDSSRKRSRLTPYCPDDEFKLFLKLTYCDLTELVDNEEEQSGLANEVNRETGLETQSMMEDDFLSNLGRSNQAGLESSGYQTPSKLPSTSANLIDDDSTMERLSRLGQLTMLNSTSIIRVELINPLPSIVNPHVLFSCDTCSRDGLQVSFQAVADGHTRKLTSFSPNSHGYDVCLPCAVFLYKTAFVRLAHALHPDPSLNRPFAYGEYAGLAVQSVSTRPLQDNNCIASGYDTGTENTGRKSFIVSIKVGVSPYGVYPVVWLVKKHELEAMRVTFPCNRRQTLSSTSGESNCSESITEEPQWTLTKERILSIPAPARDWSQHCRIMRNTLASYPNVTTTGTKTVNKSVEDPEKEIEHNKGRGSSNDKDEEEEVCPVCLHSLISPVPVLGTLCNHWFHVNCIQNAQRYQYSKQSTESVNRDEYSSNLDKCPICRQTNYMPDLSKEKVLKQNVYTIDLHVPASYFEPEKSNRASSIDAQGSGTDDTDDSVAAIGIATLLTVDGQYYNPTNMASCQLLYVRRGQRYACETLLG